MNATSNCPYEECDGSGLSIVFSEEDKSTTGKHCRCRAEMLHAKKLIFANIPKEFKDLTINSFSTDVYDNDISRSRAARAKKAAINFVNNFETFEEKGKGLYFYSYTKGSGKTRLAASLGNALINVKKVNVKFTTTLDLISEIKKTYNKDAECTESQLIEAIINIQVLILDDIGVESDTSWVGEKFYSILDHRLNKKKITIFTSNVKPEELKHDDRIKSRIEKMAVPIYLPDQSIRSNIAQRENAEFTDILFR